MVSLQMSDAGSDAGSVAPEVVEDVEVADASKSGQMSVEDALQEVLKVSDYMQTMLTMLTCPLERLDPRRSRSRSSRVRQGLGQATGPLVCLGRNLH